jgi:hypothetical protein
MEVQSAFMKGSSNSDRELRRSYYDDQVNTIEIQDINQAILVKYHRYLMIS